MMVWAWNEKEEAGVWMVCARNRRGGWGRLHSLKGSNQLWRCIAPPPNLEPKLNWGPTCRVRPRRVGVLTDNVSFSQRIIRPQTLCAGSAKLPPPAHRKKRSSASQATAWN